MSDHLLNVLMSILDNNLDQLRSRIDTCDLMIDYHKAHDREDLACEWVSMRKHYECHLNDIHLISDYVYANMRG